MDEARIAYWEKVLERRQGQTVEMHIVFGGMPTSIKGILTKSGDDSWLLVAEHSVEPVVLGMSPTGETITQDKVIPSSEYEFYVGDILTVTLRLETVEEAEKALGADGGGGGRVVRPRRGLFVPQG